MPKKEKEETSAFVIGLNLKPLYLANCDETLLDGILGFLISNIGRRGYTCEHITSFLDCIEALCNDLNMCVRGILKISH